MTRIIDHSIMKSIGQLHSYSGQNTFGVNSKHMEMKYLVGNIFDFSTKQINAQSLAACKELGVDPSDLMEKNVEYFRSGSSSNRGVDRTTVTDEIAKLRLQNYEQRRRNKMRFIVEYLKNNRQAEAQNNSPGATSQTPRMSRRNEAFYEVEMQRDNQRFEHLKRVQDNLEKNALDELRHMDQIKKHIQKKEQKANKQKQQAKTEREQNKQDNNFKFQEAISRRTAIEKQSENQSMADFERNLIDIKARAEQKSLRERALSAHTYSSIKNRHGDKSKRPESPESLVAELPKELAQKNTTFATRATSTLIPPQKDYTFQDMNGTQGKSTHDLIQPKSARRPQSSQPALLRKPTCQQEYETDYALSKFNQRMETAMSRLFQRQQERSRQVSDDTTKREEILRRLRELHDTNEFNSLQSYVLHNRKIQKQQKKKLDFNHEIQQQILNEQLSKTQVIQSHKKQNENDLRAKVQLIESKIMEKDQSAFQARLNLQSSWRLKREVRELKHLEVMEKRYLAKKLAFFEKKQLIQKQEQIRDNYNDLQMLQHNLQQMRMANDQRRLELVSHRSQQIKQAKDSFLNQCEQEDKKKKAKLSGEV